MINSSKIAKIPRVSEKVKTDPCTVLKKKNLKAMTQIKTEETEYSTGNVHKLRAKLQRAREPSASDNQANTQRRTAITAGGEHKTRREGKQRQEVGAEHQRMVDQDTNRPRQIHSPASRWLLSQIRLLNITLHHSKFSSVCV